MNKYQEALDFLFDEAAAKYEFDEDCQELRCLDCTSHDIYLNPANILQELVDKATPKKAIRKHYEDEGEPEYIKVCCPAGCKTQVGSYYNYCPECGQALDWEEE